MQRCLGKWRDRTFAVLAGVLSVSSLAHPPVAGPSRPIPSLVGTEVAVWRSSEDGGERLLPQPDFRFEPVARSSRAVIRVDDTVRYQSVLGLGSSLEHSTCYNLSLLPVDQRERVMESLVHPERGIGMNLMRNNPGFPTTILRDPAAARHVEGSAFHLYEGKPDAMSKLQREFPDKSIYFTEGSVYGAGGALEIISYFRHGDREARFLVRSRDGQFESALPARTVATYTWNAGRPAG